MATCVNLVLSLMAVENTHYGTYVQPQKAHEVTTVLALPPTGAEHVPSLQQGINGIQRYFRSRIPCILKGKTNTSS